MTRTAADKYGQAGMACPACGEVGLNVLDSRPKDKNSTIRRRRVCPSCGHRATTFEVVVTEGQDLRKLMAVLRLDVLTALAKFNQAVDQMSPEDVR